jgi:hypothetical protein
MKNIPLLKTDLYLHNFTAFLKLLNSYIVQWYRLDDYGLLVGKYLKTDNFVFLKCTNMKISWNDRKITGTPPKIWRCMHRASSYNMYINQQDAQNSGD